MADSAVLERRCRLLLRAYPPEYRADRGEEILSTLLDTTPPGRRTPSLGDAIDIIGNGLRRRWGLVGVAGLDAGLALAAPVALAVAAGISGFAWWRVEPAASGVFVGQSALFGLFRTLGPIAYASWLGAAVGWVVLPSRARRVLIGCAVAVTLTLPAVAPLTTVDRPPLWVLMALAVFGLLALAGAGAGEPALDARLMVPIGAAGIAVAASTVSTVASPAAGYYYQPTIARVGTVVTATVALLAAVAVVRNVRRKGAAAWLWAAALLGLPAGWLGPFEVGGLGPGAAAVPHFGRLAQVVLATCVAAGTLAWLARPATPTVAALRTAGTVTLGAAAGLSAFVGLGAGGLGLAGTATRTVPWYVFIPIAALVAVGVVAIAASQGDRLRTAVVIGFAALVTLVVAWLVGVYDNGWTVTGWADFGRTASLAVTIALLPLSACALVAGRILASKPHDRAVRAAAVAVLVISLGWIAYAALPHLSAWWPMLLSVTLCWVAAAVPSRRTAAP